MSQPLHDAIVGTYRQGLGAMLHLLDRAEAHCAQNNLAPETVLNWRLVDDMQPFTFQCSNVAHQSAGALRALETGVFNPDFSPPAATLGDVRTKIASALEKVETYDREKLSELCARDVKFEAGEIKLPFNGCDFMLSFALPNFYFHLTTAYALLRQHGVQIGKLDFMGQIRIKQ